MRKIFYTLGAAAAVATPLIAVVSCGTKKANATETAKPTEQTKPAVVQSTLSAAKHLVAKLPFETWTKHGNYRDDAQWWKEHKINGEEIKNVAFERPSEWNNGQISAIKIVTNTKEYVFLKKSDDSIGFDDKTPTIIRDLSTKTVSYLQTLNDAKNGVAVTEKINTPFDVWSKYGSDRSDAQWWKEHKINGEVVIAAGHEKPASWANNIDYALRLETATKMYIFSKVSSSDLTITFKENKPTIIRDKATGTETLFTSLSQMKDELKVTSASSELIEEAGVTAQANVDVHPQSNAGTQPTAQQNAPTQQVEAKQANIPLATTKQLVAFNLWSQHSFVASGLNFDDPRFVAKSKADLEFWKNHEINGEKITNLPDNSNDFKILDILKDLGVVLPSIDAVERMHYERRIALETATKIYYFSTTNGILTTENPMNSEHSVWIFDKASKQNEFIKSNADLDSKVKVNVKIGAPIDTKLPYRTFDATSIAQANALPNFKLNGHTEDYAVAKEGLYIVKHDYDGTLWEGNNKDGHALTDEIVQMPQFSGRQTVLEMGKGDSIYFLFNDNDNDELSPNNFLRELSFVDTSAKSGEAEVQFSGNAMSGVLDKWEGSQTNHASGSFDEAMMKLMHSETPADFAALAAYYGVKAQPENGHFVDDPAHANHASRAFFPMGSVPNYFGYQRVARNAFKITFNNPLDINMSMALFRIYNQNTQALSTWGSMSLGASGEWSAYEHSQTMTYNYVGRKNEFLTK